VAKVWKKGRGKLGFMQPLLGNWTAEAVTPMGPVRCTRDFDPILKGLYIRLVARWHFGASTANSSPPSSEPSVKGDGVYEEIALIGAGDEGKVAFWSFTSDGKHSQGTAADVTDLHPSAIGFEAQMPAGFARMAYWPDDDRDGYFFVVESKTAKGWRRFVEHHYRPA
jgi:hypothetical protein